MSDEGSDTQITFEEDKKEDVQMPLNFGKRVPHHQDDSIIKEEPSYGNGIKLDEWYKALLRGLRKSIVMIMIKKFEKIFKLV